MFKGIYLTIGVSDTQMNDKVVGSTLYWAVHNLQTYDQRRPRIG